MLLIIDDGKTCIFAKELLKKNALDSMATISSKQEMLFYDNRLVDGNICVFVQ